MAISPRGRKLLDEQGPRLAGTLRQCLLHGDAELRATSLLIVTTAEHYDQVSTLLQVLEQQDDPFQQAACQALQDLVNRLYEHSQSRKAAGRAPRNLSQIRQGVLTALEGACNRFGSISHAREVVECVLVLGDPGKLRRPENPAQQPAGVPGDGRLPAADEQTPGSHAARDGIHGPELSGDEGDGGVRETGGSGIRAARVAVLSQAPVRQPAEEFQAAHVRVVWIKDELVPLDQIPPALHEALSHFVQSTGLETTYKIEVQKWLMLHGSVEGRLAASHALETLAPDSVRGYLCGGLESENEDIQAWATSQLAAPRVCPRQFGS